MPFDYEKHLIISVFAIKCYLEKNNCKFVKESTAVNIEYDRSLCQEYIYNFLLLENAEISSFIY
jgi:hypothetical protein